MNTLSTIGFAGKTLEEFVCLLQDARVQRLIDIRLRPSSQLSGYARQADLRYVLEHYEHIGYVHQPDLSPTAEVLDSYRASKDWAAYEAAFEQLIVVRGMDRILTELTQDIDRAAILCSEATADKCHRRLVAASYSRTNPACKIIHL